MKKIAVILSGCGHLDGTEITESVSLIVNLSKAGAHYSVFAPNKDYKSLSHLNDNKEIGQRNALEESARITRGKIEDLKNLKAENFDGLAIPGGYGVAKNLSDWADKASSCSIDKNLQAIAKDFHASSKPILAICISPAILAKALMKTCTPSLTIGNDKGTANEIEKVGAEHINCTVNDFVSDRENKIITTPAYMYDDAQPSEVFEGISKATQEFLEMC